MTWADRAILCTVNGNGNGGAYVHGVSQIVCGEFRYLAHEFCYRYEYKLFLPCIFPVELELGRAQAGVQRALGRRRALKL